MTELNEVQRVLIKTQIQREIFKRSFFEFVKWAAALLEPTRQWSWNWHHEYICNILQEEVYRIKEGRKRNKHLIINVPPRSSKSTIVSVFYPIWAWMIEENLSFANLSYSKDLSTDHSDKVISLLRHPKFQELFPWEFDDTKFAKTDFKLKSGGTRLSGGMKSILGRGGDIIIMDDPNNTEKLSAVERHNTIQSWKEAITSRLNDPEYGLFIVVQQRLHTQDLTGYLLENEAELWDLICLPAELTGSVSPPELAAKYTNNLLWEDRFNQDVLAVFKLQKGSVGYANQLLQSPTTEEGNIIKRDWIDSITYEKFEEICNANNIKPVWDMFLDSAQTEKKKNDPSGILLACKVNRIVYIRKVIEKRLTFPDLIKELDNIMKGFGKANSKLYVEPKSNGKDIVAQLRRQTDHNVIELPSPTDDKETRLNAVAPLIESRRFVLVEDISNDIIIEQLTGFPNVSHDEFCDLTGYALNKYIKKNNMNYLML